MAKRSDEIKWVNEGIAAFNDDIDHRDCPYDIGSGFPRQRWLDGWFAQRVDKRCGDIFEKHNLPSNIEETLETLK